MSDSPNNKLETLVAVSPALAKAQTDSRSGAADLAIVTRMRSPAGNNVVDSVFDSSRPASIGSASSSIGLRMPSSFAQRIDDSLRSGDIDKVLQEGPIHLVNKSASEQPIAEKPAALPQPTTPRPTPEVRQVAVVPQPSIAVPRRAVIDFSSMPVERAKPKIAEKKSDASVKRADALHLLDGIKHLEDVRDVQAKKEKSLVQTSSDKDMLARANRARAKDKLPPLNFDPRLKFAALVSSDWQDRHHMAHDITVNNWETPTQRVKNVGVGAAYGYFENAAAMSDPFDAWMADPPHKAAIMNKNANLVGMARVGNHYTFVVGRGKAIDKSKLPNN